MPSSEIRIEVVPSDALKGNALGDPSDRLVHVILPPGYGAASERYPVVFLLAGFGGSGRSFLDYEPWDETIPELIDRLLAAGRIRPMIVVLPDAMTRYGGSQYINSPATGRYQDYLLELVAWTDRTFRTRAVAGARAIAGKSSGGFGAVRMILDRPGVFGLVADHSGDKYFEYCYRASFPKLQRALEEFEGMERALKDPRAYRPHHQAFRDLMEVAALSACYSPNPASPRGFDLPIDLETGALRDDVWQRWMEHDPLVLLDRRPESFRGLRLVFLDCGRRDEFALHVGMRLFHRRLDQLGIRHLYTEHDEGHFNLNYRYAYSLEAISAAIE